MTHGKWHELLHFCQVHPIVAPFIPQRVQVRDLERLYSCPRRVQGGNETEASAPAPGAIMTRDNRALEAWTLSLEHKRASFPVLWLGICPH